jgi:hypothetical protein
MAWLAEHRRDAISNMRGWLSMSSVAIQIAVVLVSASIASGVILVAWLGGGLGTAGCIGGFTTWIVAMLTLPD